MRVQSLQWVSTGTGAVPENPEVARDTLFRSDRHADRFKLTAIQKQRAKRVLNEQRKVSCFVMMFTIRYPPISMISYKNHNYLHRPENNSWWLSVSLVSSASQQISPTMIIILSRGQIFAGCSRDSAAVWSGRRSWSASKATLVWVPFLLWFCDHLGCDRSSLQVQKRRWQRCSCDTRTATLPRPKWSVRFLLFSTISISIIIKTDWTGLVGKRKHVSGHCMLSCL